MKRILILALLIAALTLSACSSATTNHLAAIKQAGVIKVGTSADYPPFESVDSSGNKIGFDIDLMTEIAKQMGVKLEWVDMPFDSLIAGVQQNKIDAVISVDELHRRTRQASHLHRSPITPWKMSSWSPTASRAPSPPRMTSPSTKWASRPAPPRIPG